MLRSVKPGLGFSCNLLDHNPVQNLMNFGGDEKINRKFLRLLGKVEVISNLKTLGSVTSFKIGKTLLSRLGCCCLNSALIMKHFSC